MSSERPCGVLVTDKPSGPTSQDIVRQARKFFNTKVGHTGTLDPLATGVLALVVGRATRLAQFLQTDDKEYEAELRLGETTDTLDREGQILTKHSIPEISTQQAQSVISQFVGEIQQQPPMFSAVKVDGKKLYKLARQNRIIERPFRTVSVFSLELLKQTSVSWHIRVHCSSGTYVRALAHDIGQKLGCGAFLYNLRRIRSGSFGLNDALPVEKIENHWEEAFYSMERLLPELPQVELNAVEASKIGHGSEILCGDGNIEGLYRLFYKQRLIAIGEGSPPNRLRPKVVLRSSP